MKKILLMLLIITPLAFGQRLLPPTCIVENGKRVVQYETLDHFARDFCENDRGIHTPQECQVYLRNSDPILLQEEVNAFLNRTADKVCGK